jgi:hypothetical protein
MSPRLLYVPWRKKYVTKSTIILTLLLLIEAIMNHCNTGTYLERVHFGHRLRATIFLVVVGEKHDILAHSIYIRILFHDLVVLKLRV